MYCCSSSLTDGGAFDPLELPELPHAATSIVASKGATRRRVRDPECIIAPTVAAAPRRRPSSPSVSASVRHVGAPHSVESNLARTFARFPAGLDGVLRVVMGLTAACSIGLVVAAEVFLRQARPTVALIGAEAAMIGGLSAFGVAPEVAAAAAITRRLFTTYLPPI